MLNSKIGIGLAGLLALCFVSTNLNMNASISNGAGGSLNQIGTVAGLPVSGTATGQQYNATDGYYRYVWNGSVWQRFWGNMAVAEPLTATFAAAGAGTGSPTVDSSHGGIIFSAVSVGGDAVNYRVKSLANLTPYTVIVGFLVPPFSAANNFFGISLRESATARAVAFGPRGVQALNVITVNNNTSWSGGVTDGNGFLGPTYWEKITNDGTTLKFYYGADRYNFIHLGVFDVSVASTFTTAPDQFGIAIQSESANTPVSVTWLHYEELAGLH